MAISYRATDVLGARSAGAILAGLLIIGAMYGFVLALAYSDEPGGWGPSFYEGAMTGGLIAGGLVSGQATASLAPRRPRLHTGALAAIVFAIFYFRPIDVEVALFVPVAIMIGGASSKWERPQLSPAMETLIWDIEALQDRLDWNGFQTSAAHLEDIVECLEQSPIDEVRCLDALEKVGIESRNFDEDDREEFRSIRHTLIAIIEG
jgi:hypothetical protein